MSKSGSQQRREPVLEAQDQDPASLRRAKGPAHDAITESESLELRRNGHHSSGNGTTSNDGEFALGRYSFKAAETEEEFQAIHRLNYQTFVCEIQQHTDPGSEELIDKFHKKNTYFIAKRDGQVVGMVAVHDEPPFSVEKRLPDPAVLQELGDRLLEIRLLAVQPGERNSLVFAGFVWALYNFALEQGYSHLLISGVTDKVRLYERLGFRSLGPAIPQGGAEFVPMVLDPRELPEDVQAREPMWMGKMKRAGDDGIPMTVLEENGRIQKLRELASEGTTSDVPRVKHLVSLLPGPVQIASEVHEAFALAPISHRDLPFIERFERVRRILSELVGHYEVAIMPGSGTLANDVLIANLAADRSINKGLVLANGEFGHRLVDQVKRLGLDHVAVEWEWGDRWDLDQVADTLRHDESINWVWGVHLESSTGMINDIRALRDCTVESGREVKVCVDCVSSLGSLPIDATGLHLVSGASGKSLGSYAGVAIVFSAKDGLVNVDSSRVPTYYDLSASLATDGPRFTFPSPLLLALDKSLEAFATPEIRAETFARYRGLGEYVRRELRRLGIKPLVEGQDAAPVITTFDTPFGLSCAEFLAICRNWGFELSGLSGYLDVRNWAQIATMGTISKGDCAPFFTRFEAWLMDQIQRSSHE
jgi:aspartate aminotransferase-like enzyme/predicted N-acetyltransferase YhbS